MATPLNEEDAFTFLAQFLRTPSKPYGSNYGYDLYLPQVFASYVSKIDGITDSYGVERHFQPIAPMFYAAAWEMCRRGILRPGIRGYQLQSTDDGHAGNGYSITPSGKRWIEETGKKYDYVPIEPGRISNMLAGHAPKYGDVFLERSQEAIRCYSAHAYLACCAMCGAAAESILLALAIAKKNDVAAVEKEYLGSGGRGRVEKMLLDSKPAYLVTEFRGFMSLLKYWRDSSAHGLASGIKESEAFTSLAVLLRFAQFGSDRWTDLTT